MIGVTPCKMPAIYRPKYFKMEGNRLVLLPIYGKQKARKQGATNTPASLTKTTKTQGGHNG